MMNADEPAESSDPSDDENAEKDADETNSTEEAAAAASSDNEEVESGDSASDNDNESESDNDTNDSVNEPIDDGLPKTYDFSHPQHRLNKPLSGLSVGANRLSRDVSDRIEQAIHIACTSSVHSIELKKHQDISTNLDSGTCIFGFDTNSPGKGYAIIESELVFALVQNFFGGKEDYEFEAKNRTPSTTETRLAGRLRDCIMASLGTVWGDILGFTVPNKSPIAHDQFSAAGLDSPVVATLQFELKLGSREASFKLLFPYQSLAQLHSANVVTGSTSENSQWQAGIQRELTGCELDIHGVLAETEITVNQLLKMQSGDFIPLGNVQTATFLTGSTPLFEAVIGASNGRVSASISHWLGHKDSTDGAAAHEHFRK